VYHHISACPQCGAPIYVLLDGPNGESIRTESGDWTLVREPTFSCVCREDVQPALSHDDVRRAVREAQHETYRPSRRAGFGSGFDRIPPSFGTGPKE